jgi:ABC-type spermidine/putrescine transport system permease subunit II
VVSEVRATVLALRGAAPQRAGIAMRTMVCVALPLAIGVAAGHPQSGATASFGGLAGLYVPLVVIAVAFFQGLVELAIATNYGVAVAGLTVLALPQQGATCRKRTPGCGRLSVARARADNAGDGGLTVIPATRTGSPGR